jgi:Fe-S-cluster-containing hydrogenase component 2
MTVDTEIYKRLANHLSLLGMGYPVREELIEILRENFTPLEVRVALALPGRVVPLEPVPVEEISKGVPLSREELIQVLEELSRKGLIYSGKTNEGKAGYALHQVGFGFPQTFFWKGEDTPHAQKMAGLVAKYFNRQVTREAYGSETKPYRYIPVERSLTATLQGVYPQHLMRRVIEEAEAIAVGHCPCRVGYALAGRGCGHPTEVCMKFNRMARYVIDRGFAREISKEEAFEVIRKSEEAGLVHFVDNAEGDVQHNCNCCGCACWNVGNIKRRKIPRDSIMAVYFTRETDEGTCSGCGACVEICPVAAVTLEGDVPLVAKDWCIGCGVCAASCPTGAVAMTLRPDRSGKLPAAVFSDLHRMILDQKAGG